MYDITEPIARGISAKYARFCSYHAFSALLRPDSYVCLCAHLEELDVRVDEFGECSDGTGVCSR